MDQDSDISGIIKLNLEVNWGYKNNNCYIANINSMV